MALGILVWLLPFLLPPLLLYAAPKKVKQSILLKLLLNDDQKPNTSLTYEKAVLPHSEIRQLAENLWIVSGSLPQPGPKFNRNMTIFRIPASKQLILHSVVCLKPEVRKKMELLGEVTYVIVPSSMHRLDAPHYQSFYPEAKFLCPEAALEKMNGWVNIHNTVESVFHGASNLGIHFQCVEGCHEKVNELAYILSLENPEKSKALLVTDLFFNIDPNKADFVTKMIGSANGFGVTAIGQYMADNPLKIQRWIIDTLINCPGKSLIDFIIVGHGEVIEGKQNVVNALTKAATSLS